MQAISQRNRLLFLSPVIPRETGQGAAMRAFLHIEILAELFDITLVIVSHRPGVSEADIPDRVRGLCKRIGLFVDSEASKAPFTGRRENPQLKMLLRMADPLPPEIRRCTSKLRAAVLKFVADLHFDAVHSFRLAMAPYMAAVLAAIRSRPHMLVLDLDDVESKAANRMAETLRASNGLQWTTMQRLEAIKYARLENRYIRLVDTTFVCSTLDQAHLQSRHPNSSIVVIPNGVKVPPAPPAPPARDHHVLLFVGMMNYYPNEDAITHFCADILPIIKSDATRPVRLMVVGGNPRPRVCALASDDVIVTGFVPDVTPYYEAADLVIAPLRLGGGTRIKILEAFSYRRPVVATSVGAEGLELRNGQDALLADTPLEFAQCCGRLLENPETRSQMVESAVELLRTRYSAEAIGSTLRQVYQAT